jgi:hypothetical protein
MVNAASSTPAIVNAAAEIVPPSAAETVTPPVADLVPAGSNTTVPAVVFTATFPKSKSSVFEMVIGVTIVPEAVAVVFTPVCPKEVVLNPKSAIVITSNVFKVFICFFVLYN